MWILIQAEYPSIKSEIMIEAKNWDFQGKTVILYPAKIAYLKMYISVPVRKTVTAMSRKVRIVLPCLFVLVGLHSLAVFKAWHEKLQKLGL